MSRTDKLGLVRDKKDQVIHIRVTEGQKKDIKEKAAAKHMKMSKFIVISALEATW